MTKYRKKTLIDAEQFDGSDEMIKKYGLNQKIVNVQDLGTMPILNVFYIQTLEGKMEMEIGDWIATGIKGEHWAIADDVFKQTYEEVE